MSAAIRLRLAASLVLTLAGALPAQTLNRRLDARLDGPELNRHLWGVAVTDQDGHLLYGRNADRLFVPASNTKLVVTAVATAMLGPDFTVRTSIYGTGPLEAGVLHGDLVLYGRGDPTFSRRCYAVDETLPGVCDTDPAAKLRDLAQQLRARGVREVRGDLVGDGSYFDAELIHPFWESYDLSWWYAAPVTGLGFNDNSIDVTVSATSVPSGSPIVSMMPDFGHLRLENRAAMAPEGSRRSFDIVRTPGGDRYIAVGSVPAGSPERTERAAVIDPNLFAALALRAELAAQGIVVRGETRGTSDSLQNAHARATPALAEVTSRPLRDWIFPILNISQNWFADMLLKQLGKVHGEGGSWDAGLVVERRFLIDSVGIDSTMFALSDGSGLASNNLVAPLAFTKLLAFMRKHPNYDAFAAADRPDRCVAASLIPPPQEESWRRPGPSRAPTP
jgi:D-alanyl-D-alanine carboxypeptidase/D-alanyl-D-alanine-endopeptidase (penicillin-binding protein 4)